MTRNEYEGLWTVDDVADHLKISPKTVRNKACLGQIPFVKVGVALRFRPSEIERWIDEQTAAAEEGRAA